MKRRNVRKGMKVRIWAAFPSEGAYYQGADGEVIGPWTSPDDGEEIDGFFCVQLDGSGDQVAVHAKAMSPMEDKDGDQG